MKIVLICAAHPDDEVLGCGGTIARHIACGDVVHVIFMTNGVGSRQSTSLASIQNRKKASQKALSILGCSSVRNFDFPDNKMDTVPLLDIIQSIENTIKELAPNIIYTHHIGDLNIDHQVVHKAVITACRPQPNFCVKKIYSFEVPSSTEWQTTGYLPFTPNTFIDISKYVENKKKSMDCYNEEMRNEPHARSINNTIRLNKLRGNSIGVHYAEAFMLIRGIIS